MPHAEGRVCVYVCRNEEDLSRVNTHAATAVLILADRFSVNAAQVCVWWGRGIVLRCVWGGG